MRTRIAACLDVGASLAAGAALAAAAFGPIHLELGAASVSVRTLWRPLAAAAVLFVVRVVLSSRPARGHTADVGTRRPGLASIVATSASRLVLGALIAASCVGWIVNLSSVVGGADSYGYVSAADRVRAARLIQPEPLASVMPFPDGIFAATPLGYVPAGRMANASVPAYPLGLPLLMAAAQTVAGPTGPFAVAPIAAVLLLVAAVVVAGSWYGSREVSLLAAAMIAIDPLVFTYAIQPMSDVPAATALMSAVAALSLRRPWPIVAGLAAGLALLIRPALAPAAAGLAIVPLLTRRERDWASALKFVAPVALAAIAQGWTQWYLYGDPFGERLRQHSRLVLVEHRRTERVDIRALERGGAGPALAGGGRDRVCGVAAPAATRPDDRRGRPSSRRISSIVPTITGKRCASCCQSSPWRRSSPPPDSRLSLVVHSASRSHSSRSPS